MKQIGWTRASLIDSSPTFSTVHFASSYSLHSLVIPHQNPAHQSAQSSPATPLPQSVLQISRAQTNWLKSIFHASVSFN
eukprot:100618-Pelagomonas_calceolata.AAC.3